MQIYAKVLFSELMRIFLLPFHLFKIHKNRIVFVSLTGGTTCEYSGNCMYVCEYLLQNDPGKYEIIWAVSDPEQYRSLNKKGIRLVKHFSFSSFKWLLTAKVIVSDGAYAPWFPFRKNQYFINTWHGGGAYKKIENSKADSNWATRHRAEFCAENISLFVSTCTMATKKLIRGSFCYRGEVAEIGMPRNDFLVNQDLQRARAAVIKYYNLEENVKIVLYAPTYRHSSTDVIMDADKLVHSLNAQGGKWVFLYRAHRYQEASMKLGAKGDCIKSAAEYPDMQELLAAADMLITDYSSAFWDYAFLYRPCFLYTPDLEEYILKTGFYVDISKWPFPIAKTMTELLTKISEYDAEENRRKIDAHFAYMGMKETGHACEWIEKRIAEVCGL